MRFWRHRDRSDSVSAAPVETAPAEEPAVVHLDESQLVKLSAVFSAPRWLRQLGILAWLVLGVILLLVGLIWLFGATSEITQPVLAAFVLACVTAPLVKWLQGHGVPRAGGAVIVLLLLIAVAVLITALVIGGITSQSDEISSTASAAGDKVSGWLADAGVDRSSASSATDTAQADATEAISKLVEGIATGIIGITSLALGLSFAMLSVFFLLKDGPALRAWIDRHMTVPEPVARTITGNVILSLRRYFGGVTIVAAFNAVVVGLGALILGVPLAGTIAVVTFVTAYIPYIGAFVAGFFAVVLALGSEGTTTAIIMLVIVLLANGLLQNILQPIAFGATLGLNPLVVLIVTVGAGALFGMVGLVLAAPLTSAAVHISADLARAKAAAEWEADEGAAPSVTGSPEPAPS